MDDNGRRVRTESERDVAETEREQHCSSAFPSASGRGSFVVPGRGYAHHRGPAMLIILVHASNLSGTSQRIFNSRGAPRAHGYLHL